MEYKFKDNVYKLKPDVLALYRDGIDLIAKRKDLEFKHTKGIDRSAVLVYQNKLKTLQDEKLLLTKKKKPTDKIDKQLEELDTKYQLDSEVSAINVHLIQKRGDAMLELIADKSKLFPVMFPKMLEGDASTMDFDNFEFVRDVVCKVIDDFFFVMTENKVI
ncbi:MAG TPA: hypothetical protein VMV32_01720 [Ignavibacteriaceae bacterium]|nr:hypothetical protein [Ignavibacteriaceae bacterium]